MIELEGEFDLYAAPEFKAHLTDAIDGGNSGVVVDLSEVTYLDSTMLAMLVGGMKRLRADEGQLSVVCTDKNLLGVFEVTGLDRTFPVYETRGEALADLASVG